MPRLSDHVPSKRRLQSRRPRWRKLSDSSSNIFVIIANASRRAREKSPSTMSLARRPDAVVKTSAVTPYRDVQFPSSPKVAITKNLDTLTL
ncbi:unnamed product [Ostreococcus tauri]|uniref:Unnamed product n=1 Tax=Ostreococcus tauri TaxID=70448 RepID=Q01AT0_OSTTA|nr:unnamed product [Ostreococcus tauri]OUS49487.1 hypothetical protein BE221DRAFT_65259 [Ostreococcus tauri]CAL51718.1 unnamed product [Ostreococcus tauri]|eukprot:XP_003078838.1 unnamed product [Ostreococcus tauri]